MSTSVATVPAMPVTNETLLRARLREALGRRVPAGPGVFLPPQRLPSPAPARAPSTEAPFGDLGAVHEVLPGFWQDTPAGRVFVIERRFEFDHCHGRLPLGRALAYPPTLWGRIGRDATLAAVDPRRTVFLDIETTGLSGGAGTLAFLVGIGHFLDGHFRLRQYFLASIGQERALLRALTDYLADFDALVTFNGKTFDLPLLHTRLILSGLSPTMARLPHLDLLHPARRLYRDRLGSCRLVELEQRLLGLTRVEDSTGAEAPSLYFRYLRTGRFRALLPVFEHNLLDVLSLVALTSHLAWLFGGDACLTGADYLALGRESEATGRLEEALAAYESARMRELRPVDLDDCERRLSLLYKKLGRWEDAVTLWQELTARPQVRELYPFRELAKYYEHTTRDLAAARQVTERALLLLEQHHARMGYRTLATERAELQARLARLDERLARARLRQEQVRRGRRAASPAACAEAEPAS